MSLKSLFNYDPYTVLAAHDSFNITFHFPFNNFYVFEILRDIDFALHYIDSIS